MYYYAVASGKKTGIYSSWDECKIHVLGIKNSIYKKYKCIDDAKRFIEINCVIEHNSKKSIIYNISNNPSNIIKGGHKSTNYQINDADYYVYTDGACSNNGFPNAKAGYGIYFGVNDYRNVSKRIIGKQTNNVAELTAIIETYYIIKDDIDNGKNIIIVSDSKYSIQCATKYGEKINNNKLNSDIPNKELVLKTYNLYKNTPNVSFHHIYAHTTNNTIHHIGNMNADKLAVLGCNS
jgi:ribonuclease HI